MPAPMEADVLERLVTWASEEPSVRCMLLTSSRARPGGAPDHLSDYDVILVVAEPERFARGDTWQLAFGRPLVRWGDERDLCGLPTHFRGVVYEDFVKIDYSIWPTELLERILDQGALPDQLDVGYRVLLDKDDVAARLEPASYKAHIPSPPTEAAYRALVEEFWWDTTYAAKGLRRGELVFVKSFVFEHDMRLEALNRFLEWWVELDLDWSAPVGQHGRGLERLLPSDLWSEVVGTYVGPGIEDNWDALFRMTALFGRVATEVGAALGYSYPQEIDDRLTAYLRNVRDGADRARPAMR